MNLDEIKNQLPDFAKDIKLNLSNVLSEEGSPGLNQKQITNIALASAFAARNKELIDALLQHAQTQLSPEEIKAAKAAAVIMGMNNVYYRFVHSVEDPAFATMPAKLRMTIMSNPGTDKLTFELSSLAVSAINGCSKCMSAHAAQIEKHNMSKEGIQSAVRIASVVYASAIATEAVAFDHIPA